jgi:hypothetical protein
MAIHDDPTLGFATRAIHAGQAPDPTTGAVMTPVYYTSTYAQTAPGEHKGFEYSRTHNQTRFALEANLASLEGGSHGFCFASGLAATSTVLQLFDSRRPRHRLRRSVRRHLPPVRQGLPPPRASTSATSIRSPAPPRSRPRCVRRPSWCGSRPRPTRCSSCATSRRSPRCASGAGVLLAVDNTFMTPFNCSGRSSPGRRSSSSTRRPST